MSIQRLTTVTAVTLILLGIGVAGRGPMLAPWFGVPASPAADPAFAQSTGWWGLIGFVRLFGMTLLAMGAILWVVRRSVSAVGPQRLAATMAVVGLLTGIMAFVQQMAIWGTAAGAALASLFVVLGLAYGWTAFRGTGVRT